MIMMQDVYEVFHVNDDGMSTGGIKGIYLHAEEADIIANVDSYTRVSKRQAIIFEDTIYLLDEKAKTFSVKKSQEEVKEATKKLKEGLKKKLTPIELKLAGIE